MVLEAEAKRLMGKNKRLQGRLYEAIRARLRLKENARL